MVKSLKPSASYLPTLDGWRAIAVLSVVFHHDFVHKIGPLSTVWLYQNGKIGVQVFFAISGILICSRLLDEERLNGTISLTRFYIRRAFRILPPAFLFLCVIAALAGLSIIPVSHSSWWASALFYRNYLPGTESTHDRYFTGHFWSLSLEEQFYFILPCLLVLTAARYRLLTMAGLAVFIRLSHPIILFLSRWIHVPFDRLQLNSLLIPAIFAVMANEPKTRILMKRVLGIWPLLTLATIAVFSFGSQRIVGAFSFNMMDFMMPCIVLGSVLNADSVFASFLDWPPLRYIGRISFSLYLWQQLFFVGHFGEGDHSLPFLQSWPLRLVAAFACAWLSYTLIERPLARLGHSLAPSATPGREDLSPEHNAEPPTNAGACSSLAADQ